MIHTSRQLKALVRNIAKGDSAKAQVIIRNYVTERFLERLSLSKYRSNLILKGGTLVAAMVGLDNRSTMDLDTTLKKLPLNETTARSVVADIIGVQIEDGMTFEIKSVSQIMDEADYPGIRLMLDATLESMHTPLKIDFSANDVITPQETPYAFRLSFENRSISVLAYNLETVLAEKLETLLSRGTANTRMRDFYDIHILTSTQSQNINYATLRTAFRGTCSKRGSLILLPDADLILQEISESASMIGLWQSYQRKYQYASKVSWDDIMKSVRVIAEIVK
ncbi:MAG: nucleotidyl transferase AbiEii/AbiGii toxin family protein [Eubacteriales bacterium]|nr:nucleotidyl transferase AbiEii/AbiGii toxin family protein [Eubacteriales bacterium]